MNLADLLRQAENTLNRYDGMAPREQAMALRRLLRMRDELEGEREQQDGLYKLPLPDGNATQEPTS